MTLILGPPPSPLLSVMAKVADSHTLKTKNADDHELESSTQARQDGYKDGSKFMLKIARHGPNPLPLSIIMMLIF